VINSKSHHFRRRNDFFLVVPPGFDERADAGPMDAAARLEAEDRFETCLGA